MSPALPGRSLAAGACVLLLIQPMAMAQPAADLAEARRLAEAGRVAEAIPLLERARAARPDDPEPLWMLAVARLRVGDAETAAELARDFTTRVPGNANGPLLLASAARELGRLDEAESALEEALARDPRLPEARRDLALVLAERGRTGEAIERLEALAADFPGRAEALTPLGVLYVQAGRGADGLETLLAAAQSDPTSFEAQHHLGALLSELGEFEQANRRLEAALRVRPGDPGTLLEVCRLRSREERLEDARTSCAQAASAAPESAEAWFASGDVLHYLAEVESAEGAYREALRLDPDHDRAAFRLGQLLHEADRSQEAVEVLTPVVDAAGDAPGARLAGALLTLGRALAGTGDPGAAITRFEAAIAASPSLPEPHLHLGNLLVRRDAEGARERGRHHLSRFRDLKTFSDRANELRAAVNSAPGAREPKQALIAHLIGGGAPGEALEEAERLLTLAPAEPVHHLLVAESLAALGRPAEAREVLDAALLEWPGNLDLRGAADRIPPGP